MKTLLILILTVALAAGAFLSRPSEESFQIYAREKMLDESGNFFQRISARGKFRDFMDDVQYKDRFLWVVIEKDGQTIYTGAFSRWFEHGRVESLAEAGKAKWEAMGEGNDQ